MTSDQIGGTVFLALCLALVASSLVMRRLPRGKLLSLAAIWLAILLGAWGLVMAAQKML